MTEELIKQPRVFALYYPLGTSIGKDGTEKENSYIAKEVCDLVHESLEAGKTSVWPYQ